MLSNKVLIIEDDRDFSQSLALALSLRDLQAEFATTAEEGLDKFGQEEFRLVITDIKLPGMSGIDALRRLRQLDPQGKVVIMTGFRDPSMLEDARSAGAAEILLKPFRMSHFLETVKRLVECH